MTIEDEKYSAVCSVGIRRWRGHVWKGVGIKARTDLDSEIVCSYGSLLASSRRVVIEGVYRTDGLITPLRAGMRESNHQRHVSDPCGGAMLSEASYYLTAIISSG